MARKSTKKRYGRGPVGKAEQAWDDLWKETGKKHITLLSGGSSKVRVVVLGLAEYPWAEAELKEGQKALLFKTTDSRVKKGSELFFNGAKFRVIETRDRSDYIYIAEILALPIN